MKKIIKQPIIMIVALISILGLAMCFQALMAAWTAPSAAPPNPNSYKPITESVSGAPLQTVNNDLHVVENLFVDGTTLAVREDLNRVGIGTTNPASSLDVRGDVNIGTAANRRDLCINGECLDSWPLNDLTIENKKDDVGAPCLGGVPNCRMFSAKCDGNDLVIGGDCKMGAEYAQDVVGDLFWGESDPIYTEYRCYYYNNSWISNNAGARVLCLMRD